MNTKQFEFSLGNTKHSDWADFEKLCSAFLVDDFGSMRTMAAPSGDGGRDSELFNSSSKPIVAAQYSVAKDWKQKIRNTRKKLEENFENIRILVYMTSRDIGAEADTLKAELMDKGILLDIRDKNWFTERCYTSTTRQVAAELYFEKIGLPILAGEEIIERSPSQLSSSDAKTALLYLTFQLHDDVNQKSLTKSAFEALVRSVLRKTNSENRMKRKEIHDAVGAILSNTQKDDIERFTDKALHKLTKNRIRHWTKEDEYCLTNEEYKNVLNGMAENQLVEARVNNYIYSILTNQDVGVALSEEEAEAITIRTRRVLDVFLMKLGEEFASAVVQSRIERIETAALTNIIINDINEIAPIKAEKSVEHYPSIISMLIRELLEAGPPEVKKYLRTISDSYTLYSFMKETSDVKKVTQAIFSHGIIWLDTTVILPMIAETLLDDPNEGRILKLLKTAHLAKIQFRVTTGVLEEIDSHMNRSALCARYNQQEWIGKIPYLYYKYTCAGEEAAKFNGWLSNFKGTERPLDDILEYLNEILSVKLQNLNDEIDKIDDEFRFATTRLWEEKHKRRRTRAGQEMDEAITQQLINHDIESYLGVIALRHNEPISELGYKHWLLTFDSNAWQIRDELKQEFKSPPPSPLISLDFLSRNLSIGPSREFLSKEEYSEIPLVYGFEMNSAGARNEILEVANEVRNENKDAPERVVRRKVRDACDCERRRKSCIEAETDETQVSKDDL